MIAINESANVMGTKLQITANHCYLYHFDVIIFVLNNKNEPFFGWMPIWMVAVMLVKFNVEETSLTLNDFVLVVMIDKSRKKRAQLLKLQQN